MEPNTAEYTEVLRKEYFAQCKEAASERKRNLYVWERGSHLTSSIHQGMVPYTANYWIVRPDGTVSPHQAIGV